MSSMHTTTYFRMLIVLPFLHAMGGCLVGCGEVAPVETQDLCTAECQTTFSDCVAATVSNTPNHIVLENTASYECGGNTSLPMCLQNCVFPPPPTPTTDDSGTPPDAASPVSCSIQLIHQEGVWTVWKAEFGGISNAVPPIEVSCVLTNGVPERLNESVLCPNTNDVQFNDTDTSVCLGLIHGQVDCGLDYTQLTQFCRGDN